MGQYYYIVNLDREEHIDPRKFGECLTMSALTVLLTHEVEGCFSQPSELLGSWAGQRVVIAGDEADTVGTYLSDDQLRRTIEAINADPNRPIPQRDATRLVHRFASYCCRDISEPLLLAMCHCEYLWKDIADALNGVRFQLSDQAYRDHVRAELERADYSGSD